MVVSAPLKTTNYNTLKQIAKCRFKINTKTSQTPLTSGDPPTPTITSRCREFGIKQTLWAIQRRLESILLSGIWFDLRVVEQLQLNIGLLHN